MDIQDNNTLHRQPPPTRAPFRYCLARTWWVPLAAYPISVLVIIMFVFGAPVLMGMLGGTASVAGSALDPNSPSLTKASERFTRGQKRAEEFMTFVDPREFHHYLPYILGGAVIMALLATAVAYTLVNNDYLRPIWLPQKLSGPESLRKLADCFSCKNEHVRRCALEMVEKIRSEDRTAFLALLQVAKSATTETNPQFDEALGLLSPSGGKKKPG